MSKLVLEILADANGLVKGLNQAQASLDTFMKSAGDAGNAIGGGLNNALDGFTNLAKGGTAAAGVLAAAFAAAGAAAFAMTVNAGKVAEEVDQLSQKTGIAADSIEGMSVILARSNMGIDSMGTMMKKLASVMVGVDSATGASIKIFEQMGISLDVVEKGTGATLRAIADAFQAMPDGAEKARRAVELFGKAGLDWIPILNQGAAGLDAAMRKSAEFGLILSQTARKDLTVFDDAMDDMSSALKGLGMQIGAAFAPSMVILVKAFTAVIVWTKDEFNKFSDAGTELVIRFGAMLAQIQLLTDRLFSLKAFSKAAWEETLSHVKAIGQWQDAEIKAIATTREASKSLDVLAVAHMDAAKAATVQTSSEKVLGEQIVSFTKIQLHQQELVGKHQEQRGQDEVNATKIRLSQLADRNRAYFQGLMDQEEQAAKASYLGGPSGGLDTGLQQERRGQQINDEYNAAQRQAQIWVDAYMIEENAAQARFMAEIAAVDKNEEYQGRYVVSQAIAAQQVTGFWEKQLLAVVNANAFSVAMIINTWTSGLANAIVNGGNFIQAAWKQTQIFIVQGALNTGVQLAAQWGLQASVELGILSATEATKLGMKTATNAAIVAGDTAAATATVGVWGGAAVAITGFYAATLAGFEAITATMVATVSAVGVFIEGVLSAIAGALTATVFGIPWAGAIVVGIGLIAAALAATGNLGFKDGGIGNFGSGTPATLHGPEAIIPLNSRGAAFMQDAFGGGGGDTRPIHTHVMLNGREIARAVSDDLPGALRTMGAF